MKWILPVVALLFCQGRLSAQTKKPSTLAYAGLYELVSDTEKENSGKITLFAENDTSMLFYIRLPQSRTPDYPGYLYGRVLLRDTSALYIQGYCRLVFYFSKDRVTVKGFKRFGDCGFEPGAADGDYRRSSTKQEEYFIDPGKKKIFFRQTSPETYYKKN